MSDFPVHLLVAASARCRPHSGPAQQAAIHIPLQPFVLDGERVETGIRLDGIALDLADLRRHEHRGYRFPANPQDGYIDGSVYLCRRHVPVDVTELRFGAPTPQGLSARITGTIAFAAAGVAVWRDAPLALAFVLEPPPTPTRIDAAIAAAIAATGARSARDAGRAMAWLVREHPHWEDRRALYARLQQQIQAQANPP